MAVLVTGAAGHIGSNVARVLVEHGEQVVGFDALSPPAHSVLAPVQDSLAFVTGSVLDLPLLMGVIKQHNVDAIVHLAAIMGNAPQRPVETIRVNIEGTLNMLEAGRILGLRRVISTSSYGAAASFGKDQSKTVPEDEYVLPISSKDMIPPYGATKMMDEEMTYMYRHQYGVDAAIVRPAMVYGPGRPRDRAMGHPLEAIIFSAHEGTPVTAPSGRDSTIDSTYVKDTALGFEKVLRASELPNWLYNISAGTVYSIGRMADAVAAAYPDAPIEVGPGVWHGLDGKGAAVAPVRPASDITRARRDLGYEPQFHVEEAAMDYARWLKEGAYPLPS